jgi:hypothetical protein
LSGIFVFFRFACAHKMRLRCNGLFVFLSGFYNWRAIYDKIDLRVTPPEGARNNLEHGFTDGTEGIDHVVAPPNHPRSRRRDRFRFLTQPNPRMSGTPDSCDNRRLQKCISQLQQSHLTPETILFS